MLWGYSTLMLSPSSSFLLLPAALIPNTIFPLPPTLGRRRHLLQILLSLTCFLFCKYSAFISPAQTLQSLSHASFFFLGAANNCFCSWCQGTSNVYATKKEHKIKCDQFIFLAGLTQFGTTHIIPAFLEFISFVLIRSWIHWTFSLD